MSLYHTDAEKRLSIFVEQVCNMIQQLTL